MSPGHWRITLRTFGELTFSELAGPARLPFYLCGDERIASHLFELLHTSAVATLAGEPGHFDGELNVNLQHPVAHEGLEPGQGLLPLAWNVFHGHNLLHEFFACPERFYFFTRPDCLPVYKRCRAMWRKLSYCLTACRRTG
ncbi:type VI secretion protein [Salmonella enterica subsp. enterica]|nr:type VI secretion protein [Salmonella enterica subsp. enterica]